MNLDFHLSYKNNSPSCRSPLGRRLKKNKSEKKQKNHATAAHAAAHTPDDLIKLAAPLQRT